MPRIDLDLDLFRRQLLAKATTLESPRQRQMIDVFIEHTLAEIEGDLERLMATMCPEPAFHIWVGCDIGPKGFDAVTDMYVEMFASQSNFMEMNYHKIIVDDDALLVEFVQRKIAPGRNFASGPWAESLRASGESADVSAHYLTEGRVAVIVPFDEQCRMIGEDAFSSGATAVRKLTNDELPEHYKAWLARS